MKSAKPQSAIRDPKSEMLVEVHPFKNFLPPGATHLVLGSFPTLNKNWRFNFYYPGRSNFFWRILSDVYKTPFAHTVGEEAIKERHRLILDKRIAISDVIYSVKRKVATSSKDSDLIVVEKMNIVKILRENPTIHTVILTGSSGKVSAHGVFYEHLKENDVLFHIDESTPPIIGHFMLDKRKINVYSLYSTSGINIGRYKQALEQYRKYLPE